ncbi:helix-turn-helix domain-containing protein [Clostridium perfringens]|uniref:Transcriptional regulator n=2 Tax=Clostridium perfringens TaxID=1502 RepID=A0AAP7BWA5_CLOPF|nr:helix-turn-helix domain-containing protein [Clostridium perfringens]NP_612854.1 transcriptional regulator [Clostridium phage phi3626]AAL96795.1 putative Cro-like protein [Clostridium phage phi3626]NGU30638.1 transcriptional regulator [Clostridium perfringens]WEV05051.1 transcriptional regulator [Clostridium perfringens B]
MVNLNKLKLKIFENGMNVSQLAEKIGMDRSTLYRKFQKNGDNISIKEANLMVETLHLTVEEANAIFFSNYVA